MKKSTELLRFVTLLGVAPMMFGAALAQDSVYYYGGVGLGQSRAKLNEERMTADKLGPGVSVGTVTRDARDNSYKLFGGVQLNRYFGLEAGAFRLGEFKFNATTVPTGSLAGRIRVEGVNLDLVGTLPLSESFSALARIGAQYARTRDNFTASGAVAAGNPSPSFKGGNYKAGLGLQYAFSEAMLLRGEVERYRIDDAVGHRSNIDTVSLSLVFPFGRAPVAAPRQMAAAMPVPVPEPLPMPAPVVAPAPAPAPAATVMQPPALRRVSFSAESLFGFGKSSISPSGGAALDTFARDLAGTQFDTISVEGHTDRLGSEAFNQKLSQQRADAVKNYLVESGRIAANRITATGKGESAPVTQTADCKGSRETPRLVSCLQPDRRVVVEVVGTR